MSDLFGYDKENGYKLHAFEVMNWGCFDGKVQRMEFNEESSVFFGQNSSGKSTMVDAIQTMLIPNTMRAYNSSADVKATPRRKESYVLGAKGNITDTETHALIKNNLRKKEDVITMLSICFKNVANGSFVTQIIFCYYNGDELKENIFTVTKELRYFDLELVLKGINVKNGSELRNAMKKIPGCTYFETFDRYQRDFQKRFGIDVTGLKLLKECIGSKDLGSLNITEFVRKYIIDDISLSSDLIQNGKNIQTIEDSYNSTKEAVCELSSIKKELTKADRQNRELEKVIRTGEARDKAQKEAITLVDAKNALENWYIDTSIAVLTGEEEKEIKLIEWCNNNIEKLTEQKEKKTEELSALKNDDVVRALEDKRREKTAENNRLIDIKGRRKRYENHIENTNREIREIVRETGNDKTGYCRMPGNEEEFVALRDRTSVHAIETAKATAAKLREELVEPQNAQRADLLETEKLRKELTFLDSKATNIPQEYDKIRNALAEYLGLTVAELPFAGEIMQIKADEAKWERAIEDVLAPLSLSILVEHRYMEKAGRYLNEEKDREDLNIDLTLLDIDSVFGLERSEKVDMALIGSKIEYKNHKYVENLKTYIDSVYNYRCVETFEEFNAAGRLSLVLPSGLVKNDIVEIKREKRDQRSRERVRYLGWNNERRKKEIYEELDALRAEIEQCASKIEKYQKRIRRYENVIASLQAVQTFIDWKDIDVSTIEERIEELGIEIDNLEKANKEKGDLINRIECLKQELMRIEKDIASMYTLKGGSVQRLQDCRNRLNDVKAKSKYDFSAEQQKAFIETYKERLTVENYKNTEEVYKQLRNEIDNKFNTANLAITSTATQFNSQIKSYLHPKVADGELTWELDVAGLLPEGVDAHDAGQVLAAYKAHYDKVKGSKVESSERKFKDGFLHYVEQIPMIGGAIEKAKKSVRKVINDVNLSLKEIVYDKKLKTHLQIIINENADNDCKIFKSELNSLIPDVGILGKEDNYEATLEAFDKIEKFFKKYEEHQTILRKVLDIRNYFTFYCREAYEEGREYKIHKDVDALSGGEKAQLTYTILGAALIYHLTLNNEDGCGPFRLLILDEAFSKLDSDKSEYAMKLFEDLGFQLIVVTPDPKYSLLKLYMKNFFGFTKNSGTGKSNITRVSIEDIEVV